MISKRYKNDSVPILRLNKIQLGAKRKIEDKIKNGCYKFETLYCPICDSKDSEVLSEKDRYGLAYNVVVCRKCGLVYTNPRMSQNSYNEFYDSEYRKLYVGTESPTKAFFDGQYNKAKLIFRFIKNTNSGLEFKDLKVLEIGCGAGGILFYFKEKGCIVKGVDLGSEYLYYGKEKYDLDLIQGSLSKVPEDFIPDIIIYSHVMEHILNLNSELAQLKKICSERTLLYIEVPGIKNIHNAYKMDLLLFFQNAHTFHFSLTSLTNLLGKNNFKLISGDEYVRSVFSMDNGERKPTLINDFDIVVEYLNKTEKYKYLYPFKLKSIKKKVLIFTVTILSALRLKEPLMKLLRK